MMKAATFPWITINDITNVQGTYKKKVLLTKSFLTSIKNSLFIANKENAYSLSMIKNSKHKAKGYLLELLLHGLNYTAKRIKRFRYSYVIDMHKSETLTYDQGLAIPVKSRVHKRRLLFFSHDRQLLNNIERIIKSSKVPNIYTGKGIFSREDSYRIKKGKKR